MPDIKISSLGGHDLDAYCSLPAKERGPGLIVIHGIFGVDDGMRKICDDYAAQGYMAVCPNLFWRKQADAQSAGQPPQESVCALRSQSDFDVEMGVCDLLSTLGHIRNMTGCNGKIGAVGYGLGGLLAYLLMIRSDVDSAVGYYAVGLDKYLDEVRDIRMPLLLHFAALDAFMPPEKRASTIRSVEKNPSITTQVYEGVGHDFARSGGQNYNKEAAEMVNSRTARFLAETLLS